MASIKDLVSEIIKFREERGWKKYHTPKNLAISLAVEMGELLENFQWKEDDEILREAEENPWKIAEELADVAIYLLLLSEELGIDLEDAIMKKLEVDREKYPIGSSPGGK